MRKKIRTIHSAICSNLSYIKKYVSRRENIWIFDEGSLSPVFFTHLLLLSLVPIHSLLTSQSIIYEERNIVITNILHSHVLGRLVSSFYSCFFLPPLKVSFPDEVDIRDEKIMLNLESL